MSNLVRDDAQQLRRIQLQLQHAAQHPHSKLGRARSRRLGGGTLAIRFGLLLTRDCQQTQRSHPQPRMPAIGRTHRVAATLPSEADAGAELVERAAASAKRWLEQSK